MFVVFIHWNEVLRVDFDALQLKFVDIFFKKVYMPQKNIEITMTVALWVIQAPNNEITYSFFSL